MKHKHAELMMQYAQDAMTTEKPWELWQFQRPSFDSWNDCDAHPNWVHKFNYRRKPNTTPIQYSVSCAMPIKAVSPALAAQKFREAFTREALIIQVEDCHGLVHCYLPSGELK
jgi:hypothetical protein